MACLKIGPLQDTLSEALVTAVDGSCVVPRNPQPEVKSEESEGVCVDKVHSAFPRLTYDFRRWDQQNWSQWLTWWCIIDWETVGGGHLIPICCLTFEIVCLTFAPHSLVRFLCTCSYDYCLLLVSFLTLQSKMGQYPTTGSGIWHLTSQNHIESWDWGMDMRYRTRLWSPRYEKWGTRNEKMRNENWRWDETWDMRNEKWDLKNEKWDLKNEEWDVRYEL